MALTIKNPEIEQLATEVARITKESKTEAIRQALPELKERLLARGFDRSRKARLEELLRNRIWPSIPKQVLGKKLSKREREKILGYGPEDL